MNLVKPVCRSCEQPDLEIFLDLGCSPLADRLLSEEQLEQPEPTFPLEVAFCHNCALVQILETVPPEELFRQRRDGIGKIHGFLINLKLLEHERHNGLLLNS